MPGVRIRDMRPPAPEGRQPTEWWNRDPHNDGPQQSRHHLVPSNAGAFGAGKRHFYSASAPPENNPKHRPALPRPHSWRGEDDQDDGDASESDDDTSHWDDDSRSADPVLPSYEDAVFQSKCDPNEPTDVTINLALPISANIDRELDTLERLRRTGDMRAAREFFHHNLEAYMSDDLYVSVKYAELLLDMGDYKAVVALAEPKEYAPDVSGVTEAASPGAWTRLLLSCRWKLIVGLAKSFTSERSSADDDALALLHGFILGPLLPHFELQVAVLVFRILQSRNQRLRLYWSPSDPIWFRLRGWIDWASITDSLMDEDRMWDLCDFVAATDSLLEYIAWLDQKGVRAFEPSSLSSRPQNSEAAILASLNLAVESCLHEPLTLNVVRTASHKNRPLAASLARRVMEDHPGAMRSRAYLRWLLYEAAAEGCEANPEARRAPSSSPIHPAYWNYPGKILLRGSEWIALPVYSPAGTEVPLWEPLPIPPAGNGAVLLALEMAKEMDDVPTQILAYKLLALRDPDPSLMLWAIVDLQSKQGDWYDQLETLACRYIGCNDKGSRRKLLDQLMALQERVGPTTEIDLELLYAVNAIVASLRSALGVPNEPTPWNPTPWNPDIYRPPGAVWVPTRPLSPPFGDSHVGYGRGARDRPPHMKPHDAWGSQPVPPPAPPPNRKPVYQRATRIWEPPSAPTPPETQEAADVTREEAASAWGLSRGTKRSDTSWPKGKQREDRPSADDGQQHSPVSHLSDLSLISIPDRAGQMNATNERPTDDHHDEARGPDNKGPGIKESAARRHEGETRSGGSSRHQAAGAAASASLGDILRCRADLLAPPAWKFNRPPRPSSTTNDEALASIYRRRAEEDAKGKAVAVDIEDGGVGDTGRLDSFEVVDVDEEDAADGAAAAERAAAESTEELHHPSRQLNAIVKYQPPQNYQAPHVSDERLSCL
ncbi:hypothetical protein RB595_008943 [Gaeumannomyces hyphopodioides]